MELENKYTVIKNSDILKLSIDCQMYLKHVLDSIGNKNLYIVVNRDEPYVSEVINLIEENSNNRMQKEIGIKDKRISLLTETLASRDKDIETLKQWICKLENDLLQNNCQRCILKLAKETEQLKADNKILSIALDIKEQLNEALRKSDDKQKGVIKAMATFISDKQNKIEKICMNIIDDECSTHCINCIINYFESEVKE